MALSHACLLAVNRAIYRELLQGGWSLELVIPKKLKIGSSYQASEPRTKNDPPIHNLTLTSSHPRLFTYVGLIRLLNQLQPKIVLLENSPASFLAVQLGSWARRNSSKLICLACDNLLSDPWGELMRGRLKAALSSFASYFLSHLVHSNIEHIFVLSSDGIKVMNALGYNGKVSQIPLGYDPKLFFPNERLRKETRHRLDLKETTVAYFGRLAYQKGAHLLIEALARLKDLRWQLLLDRFNTYMNPYHQELQKLIEEKELTSRIVYFDARHDEIPAYMNAADIIVVPSLSTPTWKEQYGRVAPEAMACGRLVIASDCGALPELIGSAGLIFPEKDVTKLTELLQAALLNPEMRQKVGALGEERAATVLSTIKQKELLNEVFGKFVSPPAEQNLAPTLLPISAIIPTRNRSVSLGRMLNSLAKQSSQPMEMIVVDASTNDETHQLCERNFPGLATEIIYHRATKVGATVQRNQAIEHASQEIIWFIDDDVILEPDCLARLWSALQSDPRLGGVNAMITNQQYSPPGLATRLLCRFLHGRPEASYAGKCIGPAFNLLPEDRPDLPEAVPVEWLNTTCTLYRREALPVPVFPDYFKGDSIMEDVALSLTVGRKWKLANARTAHIFHASQSGDHQENICDLSEMALVNRHYVMTHILGRRKGVDYFKLATLQVFQLLGSLKSFQGWLAFPSRLAGNLKAFLKIVARSEFFLNLKRLLAQSDRDDTEPPDNIYPLW